MFGWAGTKTQIYENAEEVKSYVKLLITTEKEKC